MPVINVRAVLVTALVLSQSTFIVNAHIAVRPLEFIYNILTP